MTSAPAVPPPDLAGHAAPAEAIPSREERRRRRLSRKAKVKRWLAARADHPSAVPLMMLLSFLDSCISPVMPEVLLLPMSIGRPARAWSYAGWASLASVLGGMFGYLLGWQLWEAGLREWFFAHVPGFDAETFAGIGAHFGHAAFVVVFLAGLTPLPYKVFTIAAGVFHESVPFDTFLLASLTSRTLRFLLIAWLINRFGPPFLDFLARRGLAMLLVSLAGLGLVVAIEALL
ncbi:MAG: DedA family protein [Planctomycetes bacterium]|nr:DedA family protein [Planctomycetota bacterium]